VSAWHVEPKAPPTATSGRTLSGRGERTRRRLLEAAEEVFGALGYHDASIVKITEAAGVAQGTFYVYFESKQEVFDELVDDLNRRVRHAMSEASARGRTRVEAERLGFRAFFAFTAEHPALYRVIRQAEFVSPHALHRHYERIAEGYIAGLERAIADGEIAEQDPAVVAWALMGVGELLGMRWILWGDPDDPNAPPAEVSEDDFEQMFAFIQRGLGARREP
jgi:AcrR family transcriptional regulator